MSTPHLEPITGDTGAPLDIGDVLGMAQQWAPVLQRVLACDAAGLDALVQELLADGGTGDAFFDALAGLDALARRTAAVSECFATAHARLLVAADTFVGEEA
jgi:hypothetical protein